MKVNKYVNVSINTTGLYKKNHNVLMTAKKSYYLITKQTANANVIEKKEIYFILRLINYTKPNTTNYVNNQSRYLAVITRLVFPISRISMSPSK